MCSARDSFVTTFKSFLSIADVLLYFVIVLFGGVATLVVASSYVFSFMADFLLLSVTLQGMQQDINLVHDDLTGAQGHRPVKRKQMDSRSLQGKHDRTITTATTTNTTLIYWLLLLNTTATSTSTWGLSCAAADSTWEVPLAPRGSHDASPQCICFVKRTQLG